MTPFLILFVFIHVHIHGPGWQAILTKCEGDGAWFALWLNDVDDKAALSGEFAEWIANTLRPVLSRQMHNVMKTHWDVVHRLFEKMRACVASCEGKELVASDGTTVQELKEFEMAAVLIEEGVIGDTDINRAQIIIRYTRLALAWCPLSLRRAASAAKDKRELLHRDFATDIIDVSAKAKAWDMLLSALETKLDSISASWDISPRELKVEAARMSSALGSVVKSWDSSCSELAAALGENLVPSTVYCPRILTDQAMYETLVGATEKVHSTNFLKDTCDVLAVVKLVEDYNVHLMDSRP